MKQEQENIQGRKWLQHISTESQDHKTQGHKSQCHKGTSHNVTRAQVTKCYLDMVLILVIACHILHFPFSVNYTFTSVKNTKSKRPDPPTSKSVDSLKHSATITQERKATECEIARSISATLQCYWWTLQIKQATTHRKELKLHHKGWTFQREFNKYRKEYLEHSYNRL